MEHTLEAQAETTNRWRSVARSWLPAAALIGFQRAAGELRGAFSPLDGGPDVGPGAPAQPLLASDPNGGLALMTAIVK